MASLTFGPWCSGVVVNWEAVSAIGTWVGAIATFCAVLVALFVPEIQRKATLRDETKSTAALISQILRVALEKLRNLVPGPIESDTARVKTVAAARWANVACELAMAQLSGIDGRNLNAVLSRCVVTAQQGLTHVMTIYQQAINIYPAPGAQASAGSVGEVATACAKVANELEVIVAELEIISQS